MRNPPLGVAELVSGAGLSTGPRSTLPRGRSGEKGRSPEKRSRRPGWGDAQQRVLTSVCACALHRCCAISVRGCGRHRCGQDSDAVCVHLCVSSGSGRDEAQLAGLHTAPCTAFVHSTPHTLGTHALAAHMDRCCGSAYGPARPRAFTRFCSPAQSQGDTYRRQDARRCLAPCHMCAHLHVPGPHPQER